MAVGAFGQDAAPPSFEVASVKASANANEPGRGAGRGGNGMGMLLGGFARGGRFTTSPGGLTARNATLSGCIQWAYGVQEYQVSGPEWISNDRFEINAKAAGESTDDQLRLMMQTLLAERFKLAFHRQTKELQAYAMVVGKNGPKLKESASQGPGSIRRERMGVTVEGVSAGQLAGALSQVLQIPVFDATGLKGRYDATVDVTPYLADAMGGNSPLDVVTIATTALQELIGLKLEARKGPIEILVIDHAERAPVEN